MKTRDYHLDEDDLDQPIFEDPQVPTDEKSDEKSDTDNEMTGLPEDFDVRTYELQVYPESFRVKPKTDQPDKKRAWTFIPAYTPPALEDKTSSDPTMTSLLAGVGVLFFILLISTMVTIAPLITGTGSQVPVAPVPSGTDGDQNLPLIAETTSPVDTPAPLETPAIFSIEPDLQPVENTVPPRSYVTIEPALTPEVPTLEDVSSNIPVPSTQDYFTIYSLTNQQLVENVSIVSFNLVNPPLVIDYQVTPFNVTDIKSLDYKIISTEFHENRTIDRAYEQSYFRVIVRDRDTGAVVLEDGYGPMYSPDLTRELTLYQSGNFRFEFSGRYATVNLTMKVKPEENIN